jgi:hypothetical protein
LFSLVRDLISGVISSYYIDRLLSIEIVLIFYLFKTIYIDAV